MQALQERELSENSIPANDIEGLVVQYKKAQSLKNSQPKESCQIFVSLSENKDFPASSLALIRSYEVCREEQHLPAPKLTLSKLNSSWMKEEVLDRLLDYSKNNKLAADEIYFLTEKSKLNMRISQKVGLIQSAVTLAKKTKTTDQIKYLQNRLIQFAPRFIHNPERNELLKVADDFKDNREFKTALKCYDKFFEASQSNLDDKYKALIGVRSVYRLIRQEEKIAYLAAAKKVAKFTQVQFKKKSLKAAWAKRFHDTQVFWARALWTEESRKDAESILIGLQKQLKSTHTHAQIFWILAKIEQEKGNPKKALDWLQKAMSEKEFSSENAEDIAWDFAWSNKQLGQLDAAIDAFEKFEKSNLSSFQKNRGKFWLALLLIERNKIEKNGKSKRDNDYQYSQKLLEQLAEKDRIGYYGMLAQRELGKPFQTFKIERNADSVRDSSALLLKAVKDPKNLEMVEWLLALDEKKLARNLLNEISNEVKSQISKDSSLLESFLHYYSRAGEYLSLFSQFSTLRTEVQEKLLSERPDFMFPTPYKEIVVRWTDAYKIDPQLVYGIMRQESAFNPEARSIADAFGLMQMLPQIAIPIAKKIKIPIHHGEDLYQPDLIIPVGIAFLRQLQDKYNDQFILTVSSYNATESAVNGWVKTRYNGNTLEFIEDVPYKETQNYIKLVMRNYIFYSRILSQESTVIFPEKLLTGIKEASAASQN